MTVNVLLITHEEIGTALLHAVTTALGELPLSTTVVTVNYDTDPEQLIPRLESLVNGIDRQQGLLILTDLFGSTPSNIASRLQNHDNVRVVAGLNLPMLVRVMNYPKLGLTELAQKALSGGKDGIVECKNC